MAVAVKLKREGGKITFEKEHHRAVPIKGEPENARLLEENALLKKQLEDQNIRLEKLEITIKKKNSIIADFEKQKDIGERTGTKFNQLVKSIKERINIYGVGEVTISILEFHHVVYFTNHRRITLRPFERELVGEIFTLLLQCQKNKVPDVYWKDFITVKGIHIWRSKESIDNLKDNKVIYKSFHEALRTLKDDGERNKTLLEVFLVGVDLEEFKRNSVFKGIDLLIQGSRLEKYSP
ncbi:hypothetical protein BC833DRAFT_620905 [Globomyces pollinis-pini]|nr:hypothetical protein BC833DRAFT_620905 [Globomyces pollinis-pini]